MAAPTKVSPSAPAPKPVAPAPTPKPVAPAPAPKPVAAPAGQPAGQVQGQVANDGADADEDEESKGRPAFDFTTATTDGPEGPVAIALEEGKLTAVPTNYNPRKFQKLERENFATEQSWLLHRARLCDLQAERLVGIAARYRSEAARASSFKDEKQRKKADLAARRIEEFEKLMSELAAEGVDTTPMRQQMEQARARMNPATA